MVIGGGLVIILAAASYPSYYFYNKYQDAQKALSNPQKKADEEVKSLVRKVGKLIELPKETPTVATVTEKKKLIDQPFFAKAENGDKVLIFPNAKKAILYRPAENKIIEVAPINVASPTPSSSGSAIQEKIIQAAVYNGTTKSGLAKTAAADIEAKVKNTKVAIKEDAAKKDYKETIVVDIRGGSSDAATSIAKAVNGKVGSLPLGEKKPDADVLVILGSNY